MKIKFTLLTLILSVHYFLSSADDIKYYLPSDIIEYDSIPFMVKDEAFESAYTQLSEMFEGKTPYNLKRAEFIIENAFFGGNLDYKIFTDEIYHVVAKLKRFIDLRNIKSYKTAPNYALFYFFTEPSDLNDFERYWYDTDNPMGQKGFPVFFTSNLLKTHMGQCVSMSLLYKILCDELGGQSALAFGPSHVYIKHLGEEGGWYNFEPTHGGYVRDVWMMETLNVSTEAIRNGIFLCALSEKETIAFMLMQLARAYADKYNNYDFFVERATKKVLDELPNFCDALVMKFNYLQERGLCFQKKYGYDKTPYSHSTYASFIETLNKIDALGYTQVSSADIEKSIENAKKFIEENKNE